MRKDTKTAKLTKIEIERNKQISKKLVYSGTVLWSKSSSYRGSKSKVYYNNKKYLGRHVQADGI